MSEANSVHLGSAAVGVGVILVLVGVIYSLTVGTMPVMDPVADTSVDDRLRPVGQVRVAGGSEAAAPAAASAPAKVAAAGSAASGEAVYGKACVVCHASGAAGAPKLGDKGAWGGRVGLGIDTLVESVTNGKGAMPPRGTCGTCSDADLRAAVEFMVSKVQ